MQCTKCNASLPEGAEYCLQCGTKVEKVNGPKKISLTCSNCNGTLTVDADKEILTCPYCGSKEMLVENDEVKIAKLQVSAKKIELEKLRMNKSQKERDEEKAQILKFKNTLGRFIILCIIIDTIFACVCFAKSFTAAGVLAVFQVLCLVFSWTLGMKIIKEKKNYIHVLVSLFGMLLAIPALILFFSAMNPKEEVIKDWNIFLLGDCVPKPSQNEYTVNYNTEDRLEIYINKVSKKQFYKYISACKDAGYNVEIKERTLDFDAYNEEGYFLELDYLKTTKRLKLELNAPIDMADLNWSTHKISEALPEPDSTKGTYETEDKDGTVVIVGDITPEGYTAYCQSCRDLGYTIDEDYFQYNFQAYNPDGYQVFIQYTIGNKQLKISLNYPLDFKQITWPQFNIGVLLPEPPNLSGCVTSDIGWAYTVCIENMTREDFDAYIQDCIDAGFENNVRNYEDCYMAENADGERIDVTFKGFNIVRISITGAYDKDYSDYKRK